MLEDRVDKNENLLIYTYTDNSGKREFNGPYGKETPDELVFSSTDGKTILVIEISYKTDGTIFIKDLRSLWPKGSINKTQFTQVLSGLIEFAKQKNATKVKFIPKNNGIREISHSTKVQTSFNDYFWYLPNKNPFYKFQDSLTLKDLGVILEKLQNGKSIFKKNKS